MTSTPNVKSMANWHITPAIHVQIPSALWSCDRSPEEAYYVYYTEQCKVASRASGGIIPCRGHEDIFSIARDICGNLPRSDIVTNLEAGTPDVKRDGFYDAAIDLTARVMLMLDIGEMRNVFSGRKRLLWTDGSMKDFVHELFPSQSLYGHEGIKLNPIFTARNLDRIAGFKVELTNNLADHLRLRDGDKTVSIFHQASFLQCQKSNPIFPEGFIDETLKTLALLFPPRDKQSLKWYRKRGDPGDLDLTVLNCGQAVRHFGEYRYWHDRLVILKESFDEARPETFMQWWNDRREGVQWYTLWVAIALTVFFGLVQSIEGALQVYKAFNPV